MKGRCPDPAPQYPDEGHAERGSGTVLAAGLGLVVIALVSLALLLAQAGTYAHRAAAAADLAALAAADAARGLAPGDPCTVAADTAARNEAQLTSCLLEGGGIVEVGTRLRQESPFGVATGRSRAGPPP
ncbi:Rv3654c family TadE-like protein [Arthrobacter sp. SW1]|uniref:Rv3654c family TadE-like protein n=1 Tax=Arthrobacter sp. SW1 TaxID=1920889 RepID=UPI00094417D6|nr:Rv3654c family TadE-like protein [Arthrobacter sp. SW1]